MDAVFCRGCAKSIHKTALACPGCGAPQQAVAAPAAKFEQPFTYYVDVLKQYAVFSGRARRKEFWYFTLFSTAISIVLSSISAAMGVSDVLGSIYSLAILLPSVGVMIRRLHDTGRSGWWSLLVVINIIFLAQEGNPGQNPYGDDPKAS
ncbi:DUF805 domain-containing protein [Paraburkholderia sp. MPAMCS5]|uniref:DUF805 domain-containing protein n=1 Tax=Paraburkholderia sp. MPAMCS5 TaxID=3112563 RepID=UPI002E19ABF6|nr:DUF805 domain-containing protein [Paraburkholderia sp. MPAMCS5]